MKTITRGCLLLLLLILLPMPIGCRNANDSGTDQLIEGEHSVQPKTSAKKTVALVMKTLTNPFFETMEQGARKAEKEFDVRLLVRTGSKETSVDQQIAIVKQLIRERVDAIVIAPGSSTELIPVLAEAQQAGIVIINIDNRLDIDLSRKLGLTDVPFISVDNEQGAYLSAKMVSDRISSPTEAIVLEGILSAENARDRSRGAERAFAENPNINVVAKRAAQWKLDEGHRVTRELFEQHPNIGVIFCANDLMALGAIRYLSETARDHVLVAGFDALDEAKNAIRQGTLQVTIDQQPALQGYKGVEFAVRALHGEKLPAQTLVDVVVVTAESL